MRFLPLALKSVFRNKRRTTLMAGGIGVSVFVISALLAVQAGFGSLVSSAGESLLNVYEKGIACPVTSRVFDSYLPAIERLPNVVQTTGVLRGLYTYQDKENLVFVSGVDYDSFRQMKEITVTQGSEAEFQERPDGALVGRRTANQYGWRPGQKVTMLEDTLTFNVSGVFESSDQTYEGGILLHKSYLAKLKRDEGKSTYFVVEVDDPGAVAGVSQAIDRDFANYPKPTKTQSERAAKERELQDFIEIRRMLSLMIIATIVVSIFGAANSVSMSVRERTKEVGILRSLGLRKRHIMAILVGEAVMVSVAGGLTGVALAAALLATGRSLGGYIPLVVSPMNVLAGVAVSLAIGLLGALLPTLRATRLKIVDSLRTVD